MSFESVSIDQVRDYWDARPCNLRHSLAPVGTRQYFDEVEARKYLVEPHIPAFADFGRWEGKRVLEVGCGLGTDTINFARAGASITATDLSAASIALAQQRAKVFDLADRIEFVEANAEHLTTTLPVVPYDLVYSFGVIHHSPHPKAVLGEIRKYLEIDGTAKVMVYNRYAWKVFETLVREGRGKFWRLDEVVAANSEAQTGCPVTYTYSRGGVRKLLEDARFEVVDLRVEHIFPFRVADYVDYRYVKRLWFRVMPQRLFRWLEHQLGWHLCVTARAV